MQSSDRRDRRVPTLAFQGRLLLIGNSPVASSPTVNLLLPAGDRPVFTRRKNLDQAERLSTGQSCALVRIDVCIGQERSPPSDLDDCHVHIVSQFMRILPSVGDSFRSDGQKTLASEIVTVDTRIVDSSSPCCLWALLPLIVSPA